LDTASNYKNEAEIGDALLECFKQGINREDIYITTKIDNGPEWNDPEAALRTSLGKL
jgi:diketogulonate reductase-like aldo/keto reductase